MGGSSYVARLLGKTNPRSEALRAAVGESIVLVAIAGAFLPLVRSGFAILGVAADFYLHNGRG